MPIDGNEEAGRAAKFDRPRWEMPSEGREDRVELELARDQDTQRRWGKREVTGRWKDSWDPATRWEDLDATDQARFEQMSRDLYDGQRDPRDLYAAYVRHESGASETPQQAGSDRGDQSEFDRARAAAGERSWAANHQIATTAATKWLDGIQQILDNPPDNVSEDKLDELRDLYHRWNVEYQAAVEAMRAEEEAGQVGVDEGSGASRFERIEVVESEPEVRGREPGRGHGPAGV